jgi:hypothetical protein
MYHAGGTHDVVTPELNARMIMIVFFHAGDLVHVSTPVRTNHRESDLPVQRIIWTVAWLRLKNNVALLFQPLGVFAIVPLALGWSPCSIARRPTRIIEASLIFSQSVGSRRSRQMAIFQHTETHSE